MPVRRSRIIRPDGVTRRGRLFTGTAPPGPSVDDQDGGRAQAPVSLSLAGCFAETDRSQVVTSRPSMSRMEAVHSPDVWRRTTKPNWLIAVTAPLTPYATVA